MFLLLALFIVVPLVELYVIIKIGGAIGVLPTIALLLLDSILGTMLLRSQGRAVWARFQAALAENRIPGREVFDGAMVIIGGTLLLTPGFVTDVVGLVFLIPPTRDLVRRLGTAIAKRRTAARVAFWGFGQYDRRRERPRGRPPGLGPVRPRRAATAGPGAPVRRRGHGARGRRRAGAPASRARR